MLTPKPKLYSSDWSPGMVVLKNIPNQNLGPKSCANFLGSSGSNALKPFSCLLTLYPTLCSVPAYGILIVFFRYSQLLTRVSTRLLGCNVELLALVKARSSTLQSNKRVLVY